MSQPSSFPPRTGGLARGFTLVELLTVLTIMAILAALSALMVASLNGSHRFSSSLDQIAGILEQARTYATGQDTYVWVVFYPYDPSTLTPPDGSGDALCVAVFASNDGTDPVNWTPTTINLASGTASVSGTTLSQVLKHSSFKQIAIRTENYFTQGTGDSQISSLPSSAGTSPTGPASLPLFQITFNGTGAAPITLPSTIPSDAATDQPVSVIQFTPTGAARVSGSPVDAIWIDFQQAKAKGVLQAQNIAALRVNGLTGMATIYRK